MLHFELRVHLSIQSLSDKNVVILNQCVSNRLFISLREQCVSLIKSVKEFSSRISVFCGVCFFLLEFSQFFEDSCLYWGLMLLFLRIVRGVGNQNMFFFCSVFFCSKWPLKVRSEIWITFRSPTKNCHLHWSNEIGLLRNDYGELCNLFNLSDCVWWFRCVSYSD